MPSIDDIGKSVSEQFSVLYGDALRARCHVVLDARVIQGTLKRAGDTKDGEIVRGQCHVFMAEEGARNHSSCQYTRNTVSFSVADDRVVIQTIDGDELVEMFRALRAAEQHFVQYDCPKPTREEVLVGAFRTHLAYAMQGAMTVYNHRTASTVDLNIDCREYETGGDILFIFGDEDRYLCVCAQAKRQPQLHSRQSLDPGAPRCPTSYDVKRVNSKDKVGTHQMEMLRSFAAANKCMCGYLMFHNDMDSIIGAPDHPVFVEVSPQTKLSTTIVCDNPQRFSEAMCAAMQAHLSNTATNGMKVDKQGLKSILNAINETTIEHVVALTKGPDIFIGIDRGVLMPTILGPSMPPTQTTPAPTLSMSTPSHSIDIPLPAPKRGYSGPGIGGF